MGYSQRQRVGGLQARQFTHVHGRADAIHPSYWVVTRSLAQVLGVGVVGGELGVRQGSSSAIVPLDDESLDTPCPACQPN